MKAHNFVTSDVLHISESFIYLYIYIYVYMYIYMYIYIYIYIYIYNRKKEKGKTTDCFVIIKLENLHVSPFRYVYKAFKNG